MDMQVIRLVIGVIVLFLGLILARVNPDLIILGFLLFYIGLIIGIFGPMIYGPLLGQAKSGNKLKSFAMILSIIISLLLVIVFLGIETNSPNIVGVLLTLFPDINLPIASMWAVIGVIAIPLGSYVFLYGVKLKRFAKVLGTIVSVTIIILVLTLLTKSPIFLLFILLIPFGYSAFLIYKYILLREGSVGDITWTIFGFWFTVVPLIIYLFGLILGIASLFGIVLVIAIEYYFKPVRTFILRFKYRYKMSKIKKSRKKSGR